MIAKKSNLPPHVVKALMHSDYDYVPEERQISVTTLLDDPHNQYLRGKYGKDIEVKPEDNFWIMFGNIVHTIIEKGGNDVMSEFRLYASMDTLTGEWYRGKRVNKHDWELSGQVDAYDPVTRTLYDNKVTTKWTLLYNPQGKREHQLQLNIYAWLLRKHGIPVDKLELVYFIRDLEKKDKYTDKFDSRDIVTVPVEYMSDYDIRILLEYRLKLYEDFDINESKGCAEESRWRKPDAYAIVNPKTSRALPNCSSFENYPEAAKVYNEKGYTKKGYKIEYRAGADIRCEDYCNYRNYCIYWTNKI